MSKKNKKGDKVDKNSFAILKGKTITKIEGLEVGSYNVKFYCSDGTKYGMYPDDDTFLYGNDCTTSIEDINGNVEDLIGQEILKAEERENAGKEKEYGFPCRWTFYTLATIKDYVDIRWYGEHNGYYSDKVLFYEIDENNNTKN